MRWNEIKLSESERSGLPKAFLFRKWKERAAELRRPEPRDLTGACKFAAVFAQDLYGGVIEANEFHTWVNLNGRIIDLCEDASDVEDIRNERVPPYMADYVAAYDIELPYQVYEVDEEFMSSRDFQESIESCRPRVAEWAKEFIAR